MAGERALGHAWRGGVRGRGGGKRGRGTSVAGACVPPQRILDRSMGGRYASYWNAFLFFKNILLSYD